MRRVVSGSVEWARLEPAGETSVSQFIDSIFCNDEASSTGIIIETQKYVYDSFFLCCASFLQL